MSDHPVPLLLDVRRATRGRIEAIEKCQRPRFATSSRTRVRIPRFCELYRTVPAEIHSQKLLSTTDKN